MLYCCLLNFKKNNILVCLFDPLRVSQLFFNYVMTCLPGLNHLTSTKQGSRTQPSSTSEARTCNPSISSKLRFGKILSGIPSDSQTV